MYYVITQTHSLWFLSDTNSFYNFDFYPQILVKTQNYKYLLYASAKDNKGFNVSYQIIPDAGKVLDGGGSYWEESSGGVVHYIVKNTDRLPYPMTKSYDKSSLHIKFK